MRGGQLGGEPGEFLFLKKGVSLVVYTFLQDEGSTSPAAFFRRPPSWLFSRLHPFGLASCRYPVPLVLFDSRLRRN